MKFRRYQYFMDKYGVSRSMLVKVTKDHPEMCGYLGRIPMIDEDGFIDLIQNGGKRKQQSAEEINYERIRRFDNGK